MKEETPNLKDNFKRNGYSIVSGGAPFAELSGTSGPPEGVPHPLGETEWRACELFAVCDTRKDAEKLKKALEVVNPGKKLRICRHWGCKRHLEQD